MPPLPPPGLKPLDVDGVSAMVVGTVAWAVASVVCLVRWSSLSDDGREWWLPVCLTGVLLGLMGVAYCTRRRSRLRRT